MARTPCRLYGRAEELVRLRAALAGVRSGRPAAVLLGGDAGVGKTRLLEELLAGDWSAGRSGRAGDRSAEASGAAAADGAPGGNGAAGAAGAQSEVPGAPLILVGHCVDLGDTPPPYLPFAEAFGRLPADHPQLAAELCAALPAVARLLPGGLSAEESVAPTAADAPLERGELFAAVVGALAWLAERRPTALVVEDLHWADAATRDLLGYLFTRLDGGAVALIGTYRTDDLHRRHPLRPVLAQWARLSAVERILLEPLNVEDIRALVRSVQPVQFTESGVHDIVARADGNPFFAEELAHAAGRTDVGELPWQLADLLLVRLDGLRPAARCVVDAISVGRGEVPHELLREIAGQPDAELEEGLHAALDAQLISATGVGYRFRHALLGEAVYDDLLPSERERLHAEYVRALTARAHADAAQLARHARAAHDDATALRASIRAGEEALALAAPQQAVDHYLVAYEIQRAMPQQRGESAADGDSGGEQATVPGTSAVLRRLVDAAVAAGRQSLALRLAREALAGLPADAPAERRAETLYALAAAEVAGEAGPDLLSVTTEALELIRERPPTMFRTRLIALHARVALSLGREAEAEQSAREAVREAAVTDSPRAKLDANTTLASVERRIGDPDKALRLLQVAVADAAAGGDEFSELRSRYTLSNLQHEQGDLTGALDTLRTLRDRAAAIGRQWQPYALQGRVSAGMISYERGDWDAALRILDVAGQRPPGLAEALLNSAVLVVRADRGARDVAARITELRPRWREEGLIAIYCGYAGLRDCAVALAAAGERNGGRRTTAAERGSAGEPSADATLAAEALADEAFALIADLWADPDHACGLQLAALVLEVLATAAAGANADRRTELAQRGERHIDAARRIAAVGVRGREMGPEGRAWARRADAEWARLRWLADVDAPTPEEHLRLWSEAVAGFGYGELTEQTRSRIRLAAVLRAAGDTDRASAEADQARIAATAMGATSMLTELQTLGRTPTATQRAPGGLTTRERDVLALLTEGRTNRQIAGRLYISEKTVSVHVSNILAKLRAGSRTEAAAVARRDRLLD